MENSSSGFVLQANLLNHPRGQSEGPVHSSAADASSPGQTCGICKGRSGLEAIGATKTCRKCLKLVTRINRHSQRQVLCGQCKTWKTVNRFENLPESSTCKLCSTPRTSPRRGGRP